MALEATRKCAGVRVMFHAAERLERLGKCPDAVPNVLYNSTFGDC